MTAHEDLLLGELSRQALAHPFAGRLSIFGLSLSRGTARAMETALLRQRMAERKRLRAAR